MATFPIYQFYVELENYEPKMWRRFQVMNDITIARLGYIIMTLFELRNYYPYEVRKDELEVFKKKHPEYAKHPERLDELNIEFKKMRYGITNKKNLYMYTKVEKYGELLDATKTKIGDLLKLNNEEITFYYDPEINWKIKVVLEKSFIDKNLYAKELPKILDGSGYGIIEKCNNTKELQQLRDELKARRWINNSDYKYYSLNDKSNRLMLDKFDIDDMNYRVKVLPRTYEDEYEKKVYPSYQTMKIRKRRYKLYKKIEN